jgi:hypothetical protein
MSHNGHDTQQELQYENEQEEQLERVRILQNRITFLGSLPFHLVASRHDTFGSELREWREEIREGIEDLLVHIGEGK